MWLDLSFRAEKENEYLKTLIFNFDQKNLPSNAHFGPLCIKAVALKLHWRKIQD